MEEEDCEKLRKIKEIDFVEVHEVYKVNKSGEFNVAGETLAVIANGKVVYVADEYAAEVYPMDKKEAEIKYNL